MTTPFDHVLLLAGKITVLWSQTEHHFERIIWVYTDSEARIGETITSMLGNVSKAQLLLALAERIESDAEILEHLRHLAACYDICRENRNTIIHALLREDEENGEPIMLRSRRFGGFNVYDDAAESLERVASEVAAIYEYCRALDQAIWAPYVNHPPNSRVSPIPWPDRPRLPRKLEKPRLQEDHPAVRHPLDSSRE